MLIDAAHALRTHVELVGLVEAIRDAAGGEPETDSLEWKTDWDLADASVRYQTARHILGFGNRTVAAAARQFEGCAYFVAGVEPGELAGVAVVDAATLDDYISAYVLPSEPRWTPHYVTVDEKPILVISIEAPRAGDHAFTLQKGHGNTLPGTIFVRRHGKTVQAEPAEVRALEGRLQAARPTVELSVVRTDDGAMLHVVEMTEAERRAYLDWQLDRLLAPLVPRAKPNPPTATALALGVAIPPSAPMRGLFMRDARSEEEFRNQVNEFASSADRHLLFQLAKYIVDRNLATVALEIVNATVRNFEGVQVVIDLPLGIRAWLSVDDAAADIDPPTLPIPWGKETLTSRLTREVAVPNLRFDAPEAVVRREGSHQSVRFAPHHVRPKEPVPLAPFYVAVPAELVGRTVSFSWRLTSTTADDMESGEITYDVADTPVMVARVPQR